MILDLIGTGQVTQDVIRLLERMVPDPVNKPQLVDYLRRQMDRGKPAVELRTVIRALARKMKPNSYLEVGVRLGWSMAQVMAESLTCAIVGCDSWVVNYGGVQNYGAGWLRHELKRVVPEYAGILTLISGESQVELPLVTTRSEFDLICVDGDHTGPGALADLRLCLPMVAPGGALVFDDLVDGSDDNGAMTLRDAWRQAMSEHEGFTWHEFDGLVPVGVAVRV